MKRLINNFLEGITWSQKKVDSEHFVCQNQLSSLGAMTY